MKYVNQIVAGDAKQLIKEIPDETINLILCSPPYFQQRSYTGVNEEIGTEQDVERYIDNLLTVMRECVRVIKQDGNIVFNLGDKCIDGGLLLVPYRFAFKAIEQCGIKLINNICWVKNNPPPKSNKRKLVPSHEPFFHFIKSNAYYYDTSEANKIVKPKASSTSKVGENYFSMIESSSLTDIQKSTAKKELLDVIQEIKDGKISGMRMKIMGIHALPYGGQKGGRLSHMVNKGYTIIKIPGRAIQKDVIECSVETIKGINHIAVYPRQLVRKFVKLLTKPDDLVLDPFVGSGTTAVVCKQLSRRYIGFDLSEDYVVSARARINATQIE